MVIVENKKYYTITEVANFLNISNVYSLKKQINTKKKIRSFKFDNDPNFYYLDSDLASVFPQIEAFKNNDEEGNNEKDTTETEQDTEVTDFKFDISQTDSSEELDIQLKNGGTDMADFKDSISNAKTNEIHFSEQARTLLSQSEVADKQLEAYQRKIDEINKAKAEIEEKRKILFAKKREEDLIIVTGFLTREFGYAFSEEQVDKFFKEKHIELAEMIKKTL